MADKSTNTIATAYVQITPSMKGLQGALEKEFGGAGKSAGKLFTNAFSGIMKTAAVSTVATTAALAGFTATSVNAGKEFDASMSQVAATMGLTMDELNNNVVSVGDFTGSLRDFAQEMGATTAFSATQSAEALNYMALAGYNAETAVSMLPTVLNLAAAGGIELASASDMVTDAQSALGLSLEETGIMVDQMAAASSKSNTSVAQLGEAFLTIGANAKSLSGGTKELSTALGLLADNGIKGAEGGTHLRNILLAMNPTTDAAAAAWEKLGVSAYDTDGNLRPLESTFSELSSAMKDMSDQERTDMLSKMFNKTDLAAVNALLATSTERWQELGGAIDKSSGAAANMADTQLDNLAGDITLFQSALEGVQIAISDMVTPEIREFVQMASEGLGEVTTALSNGDIEGAFDAIGDFAAEAALKLVDMAPEMVTAGISLLGSFVGAIVENAPEIMSSAKEVVSELSAAIIDNLPMIIETGMELLLDIAIGIAEALPELIPTIVDVLLTIVDTLVNNIDLLVDGSIALVVGLTEGIINALPILIEKAPEIIVKLVDALAENTPKILEAGAECLVALRDGIMSSLPDLLSNLYDATDQINEKFKEGFAYVVDIGKFIVEGIWDGISGANDWLKDKIKEFASGIVTGIKDILGIKSPSKVFSDSVGQWIPKGISVGIEGNTDSVRDAMRNLANESVHIGMNVPEQLLKNGNYSIRSMDASQYGDVYELLAKYMPMIANGMNITMKVEGDTDRLFKVMREKNMIFKESTGESAFA